MDRLPQGVVPEGPLTGHRLQPSTGETPATPVELQPEQLPIRIIYQGRRYILKRTALGKLIMNGDEQ